MAATSAMVRQQRDGFFFSSRRRHTRSKRDWSSDVCSSDLELWRPPTGRGVRVDHGMKEGLAISPFYDSMIAKVIAHGVTREQARARLVQALRDFVVLGPTTNRHFLIRLLEHREFVAGKATTAFVGKHAFPPPTVSDHHWHLAASLLWRQSTERHPPNMRGWRNSNPEPTPFKLAVGEAERTIQLGIADVRLETPPFYIDGNDIIVDLDAHTVRFQDRTYMP